MANEKVTAILNTKPRSVADVNRLLKQEGVVTKLVRGKGYYYFVDGGAEGWYTSSVGVFSCKSLTLGTWLAQYLILRFDWHNTDAQKFGFTIEYQLRATSSSCTLVAVASRYARNPKGTIFTGDALEMLRYVQQQQEKQASNG